jgi:hypothetical protein
MSRQYDRYERRSAIAGPRRSGLTHWVPLVLTITAATVGLVAWIWSERNDDDDDEYDDGTRPRPEGSLPPSYGDMRQGESAYGTTARAGEESSSYMARMSGALKRTPSPQQFFNGASRTVAAGVAAAGAAVGSALYSIREDDKNAYKDHKTWSEEAELRKSGVSPGPAAASSKTQTQKGHIGPGSGKRKTVAIVISADADMDGLDDGDDYVQEHAVCFLSLDLYLPILIRTADCLILLAAEC